MKQRMRDIIRGEFLEMLSSHLDPEVISYLKREPTIVNLLVDYLVLIRTVGVRTLSGAPLYDNVTGRYKGTPEICAGEGFSDCSFLIAPVYKAFEGYLFALAESLGLKTRDEIVTSIGRCYDEDQITQTKKEIVTETGKLIDKKDKEGLGKISELKRVLEQYRHSPAHYYGTSLNTFQKATNYGSAILTVINETTKFFLERGDIETR